MLSKYKRSSIIGIGAGVIAFLAGVALITSSETPEAIPRVVGMLPAAGYILLIWGCRAWAKGKGYHGAWGLLGLMHVFGPIVVACFPDRFRSDRISSVRDPALLVAALEEKDAGLRSRAALKLGKEGGARAVEQLLEALKDEDWRVGQQAADELGAIGDARAVGPLMEALEDDAVRGAAAVALGRIGDARAVEPLVEALEDEDMRDIAAEALGRIGDVRAMEPLLEALKDERREVQDAAAEALEQIDPEWTKSELAKSAVKELVLALEDKDEGYRKVAAETLGRIGDVQAVEPLLMALKDENMYVRDAAAEALEQIDPEWAKSEVARSAVQELVLVLEGGHGGGRRAAAKTLGLIGDVRAVEPLVSALQENDGRLRKEASEALIKIEDPRAEEAVRRFEKEKSTCYICGKDWLKAAMTPSRDALARAGGDSVVAAMVGFVERTQAGKASLLECRHCGRAVCPTCAEEASRALTEGNICPACNRPL